MAKATTAIVAAALVGLAPVASADPNAVDLTQPTLYVVGYSHLDTQWRWTYVDTIREFIPSTLNHNFALFEKYPDYVFNFGGSRRYEMMREYYPDGYEKLKGFVRAGRWFPCGSSVDENDANVPSAESQIRHALYGNRYFRQEFGVASDEFMLPDCFGFPASLPSVLAHCGIKGFSTQKLTWNAVVPIPFKVGVWNGPDGRSVIAALDPGAYVGKVKNDLAMDDGWHARIMNNGAQSGAFVDYHYFGTGDQGGAPDEASVAMVEQSIATGNTADAKQRVICDRADAMFNSFPPDLRARLPQYTGELELTQHSAGSVTSQAYMKRWNRKNELLADSAEKVSVAAWLLGAGDYPAHRLQDAWELVLGSQMHDILPGTSVPKAYEYSWNDEVIAANQFSAVVIDAASAVISKLDTTARSPQSRCVVVFNPLSWEREDVVEVEIPFSEPQAFANSLAVFGPDHQRVPSQVVGFRDSTVRVAFLASAPPMGFASYELNSVNAMDSPSTVSVSNDGRRLENEAYVVTLDDRGDVASIYDKRMKKELLAAPARLGLFYENPSQWPAWNQDWDDRTKPARAFAGESGPVSIEVVERGPARVAVRVTREAEGSTFTQEIRLGAGGAADRIEFDTTVDWRARERSLRASFPLTAANPVATYDIQVGAIERPNGHKEQYEYGFHQWFDLTDASGDFGASIACDSKYGADKPDDSTVRLTLLYTPGTRGGYPDQGSQDLGRHHVLYSFQGHAGDWRDGESFVQAARLNQPLMAFASPPHPGPLGKTFSLVQVSDPNVSLQALKKAEDSIDVVVRLREHTGRDAKGVRLSLGAEMHIESAREIDGQERDIAPGAGTTFEVRDGVLVVDIGANELRAFALLITGAPEASWIKPVHSTVVELPFDADVVSSNADRADGSMNDRGESFPAEQYPKTMIVDRVEFGFGPTETAQKNALTCRGQEITLHAGEHARVSIIAASSAEDVATEFEIGGERVPATIPSWIGYVGQWDNRVWPGDTNDPNYPWGSTDIAGLVPGYIKDAEIAWFCSHHHSPRPDPHAGSQGGTSDAIYQYCYLFKHDFDLPSGATNIRLPNDPRITVFAITVSDGGELRAMPAHPLFDRFDGRATDPPHIETNGVVASADGSFADTLDVTVEPGLYWRAGSLRYTTDGSAPTAQSAVYDRPITVSEPTTVSVGTVRTNGTVGGVVVQRIDVRDATPPKVSRVQGVFQTQKLHVDFSEPLDPSAATASLFAIEPAIAVTGATLSDDARSVSLTLGAPPEVGTPYTLHIHGVKDASPARNEIAQRGAALSFSVAGPVFSKATIVPEDRGKTIENTPGLPVHAADPWTINLFVRMDAEPKNHTVLAGFGRCADRKVGGARYLCKFAGGIHFWSSNQDVLTRTPYDLGAWQMITATYDGTTARLYKDAQLIGERDVHFADEDNIITIAPKDPWDDRYQFDGELAGFTVWNSALGPEALEALKAAGPG